MTCEDTARNCDAGIGRHPTDTPLRAVLTADGARFVFVTADSPSCLPSKTPDSPVDSYSVVSFLGFLLPGLPKSLTRIRGAGHRPAKPQGRSVTCPTLSEPDGLRQ